MTSGIGCPKTYFFMSTQYTKNGQAEKLYILALPAQLAIHNRFSPDYSS